MKPTFIIYLFDAININMFYLHIWLNFRYCNRKCPYNNYFFRTDNVVPSNHLYVVACMNCCDFRGLT